MKTREAVTLILTIISMAVGGVYYAFTTFETKDENKEMHRATDSKIDLVIDMVKRIDYKLDRRK